MYLDVSIWLDFVERNGGTSSVENKLSQLRSTFIGYSNSFLEPVDERELKKMIKAMQFKDNREVKRAAPLRSFILEKIGRYRKEKNELNLLIRCSRALGHNNFVTMWWISISY